jgi:hypothetical protein
VALVREPIIVAQRRAPRFVTMFPSMTKHTWAFKARFRSRAYAWHGSNLACRRLNEAVAEIKTVARVDAVTAGDGVVSLLERIWPAFQNIDTSSGAVGGAVAWTQAELLPILIQAPAARKTRDRWLDRLWQAIQDDGVSYLWMVEERWGELCASPQVASVWAGRFLEPLRAAWSSLDFVFLRGETLCLSSLLAAGRHHELLDVLALRRFPDWSSRKFGVQALLAEGRIGEALAYAEASRGLNQPGAAIDAACEKILLDAGRIDEAYDRYALTANAAATGLATFRAISQKYPSRDRKQILHDLAAASGDPGRWFAAAKHAGFLDLAREFAQSGRTDPRTLSRASRDFVERDPAFSHDIGRLAIQRILEGYGYDLTALDVIGAYAPFIAAAQRLGIAAQARQDILTLAATAQLNHAPFSDTLFRACSGLPEPPPPPPPKRRTGSTRRPTRW